MGVWTIVYLINIMGRSKRKNKNVRKPIHNRSKVKIRKTSHITLEYRKLLLQMININKGLSTPKEENVVISQTKEIIKLRYPHLKNIEKLLTTES